MRWPASRSSPSARSPAARRRRASCSPRRLRGRDRGARRRLDRDRGRTDLRPRRRRAAGAPPPPARRDHARRADPCPRRTDEAAARALARGVLSLGARAPAVDRSASPMARPRGVPAPRRARPWPDLSDAALAADPGWLAPFLAGKTRLAEIGADDLAAALGARSTDLARASTTRRRPISARRPASASPSTTRPKAARRLPCACRRSSASPSIRRSPAAVFR